MFLVVAYDQEQEMVYQKIENPRPRFVLIQTGAHKGPRFIGPRGNQIIDFTDPIFRQPHIFDLSGDSPRHR
jgi:hypothetical protein